MPKIPTFEAQVRPTTEVASLKTQFQVPVESAGSMFGAAQKVVSAADEYYVREQALKDKTESTKAYLELSNDIDTIQQGSSKILDPEKAQSTFKDQFSFLAKQKIDGMENKAAARLLEDKLSLDLITRSSKVVKGSRDQLDLQYNSTWNTEQQSLISKYFLTTDQNEKNIIKSNIDSNVASRNFYNNDGQVKLEEDLKKTNASLFEMEIDMDYAKKNYSSALTKLQDVESSKFLTAEKRMQLYQKGFKEFQEESKIQNAATVLKSGLGFYAKSGQLKDLKKEDLEKAMVLISQERNKDGSPVFTQPQIAEMSINNNVTNPIHKEVIRSGFTNIALTGSETMVAKGYETYRDYINQGGRNFLQTTMNLDKDEIEFYDRYDFLVSTMKYTPAQASVAIRDLQKNVNTPEFKAKIIGDKKIKSAADGIVSRFGPYNDYENKQFVYNTVSRLANTVYKIQGTEEQAVEYATNMIDKNYRKDIFDNMVAIKQNRPQYHDAAVKYYIQTIWDQGIIDKKNNKLSDIIAIDVEPNLFNDEAGIKIVNRNQPYAILTTFQNAQGDFDSNKFGSLYLTQSDLQKKVYPVGQDKRYQDFLYKYMIREKSVNMFKKDKLLKKEEDINNQYFPNQQVK
jgi:hypothetical protein